MSDKLPFDVETCAYIQFILPHHSADQILKSEFILGVTSRPHKYCIRYEVLQPAATTKSAIKTRWESEDYCHECLRWKWHTLECKKGPWHLFMIQSMVQPRSEQHT